MTVSDKPARSREGRREDTEADTGVAQMLLVKVCKDLHCEVSSFQHFFIFIFI